MTETMDTPGGEQRNEASAGGLISSVKEKAKNKFEKHEPSREAKSAVENGRDKEGAVLFKAIKGEIKEVPKKFGMNEKSQLLYNRARGLKEAGDMRGLQEAMIELWQDMELPPPLSNDLLDTDLLEHFEIQLAHKEMDFYYRARHETAALEKRVVERLRKSVIDSVIAKHVETVKPVSAKKLGARLERKEKDLKIKVRDRLWEVVGLDNSQRARLAVDFTDEHNKRREKRMQRMRDVRENAKEFAERGIEYTGRKHNDGEFVTLLNNALLPDGTVWQRGNRLERLVKEKQRVSDTLRSKLRNPKNGLSRKERKEVENFISKENNLIDIAAQAVVLRGMEDQDVGDKLVEEFSRAADRWLSATVYAHEALEKLEHVSPVTPEHPSPPAGWWPENKGVDLGPIGERKPIEITPEMRQMIDEGLADFDRLEENFPYEHTIPHEEKVLILDVIDNRKRCEDNPNDVGLQRELMRSMSALDQYLERRDIPDPGNEERDSGLSETIRKLSIYISGETDPDERRRLIDSRRGLVFYRRTLYEKTTEVVDRRPEREPEGILGYSLEQINEMIARDAELTNRMNQADRLLKNFTNPEKRVTGNYFPEGYPDANFTTVLNQYQITLRELNTEMNRHVADGDPWDDIFTKYTYEDWKHDLDQLADELGSATGGERMALAKQFREKLDEQHLLYIKHRDSLVKQRVADMKQHESEALKEIKALEKVLKRLPKRAKQGSAKYIEMTRGLEENQPKLAEKLFALNSYMTRNLGEGTLIDAGEDQERIELLARIEQEINLVSPEERRILLPQYSELLRERLKYFGMVRTRALKGDAFQVEEPEEEPARDTSAGSRPPGQPPGPDGGQPPGRDRRRRRRRRGSAEERAGREAEPEGDYKTFADLFGAPGGLSSFSMFSHFAKGNLYRDKRTGQIYFHSRRQANLVYLGKADDTRSFNRAADRLKGQAPDEINRDLFQDALQQAQDEQERRRRPVGRSPDAGQSPGRPDTSQAPGRPDQSPRARPDRTRPDTAPAARGLATSFAELRQQVGGDTDRLAVIPGIAGNGRLRMNFDTGQIYFDAEGSGDLTYLGDGDPERFHQIGNAIRDASLGPEQVTRDWVRQNVPEADDTGFQPVQSLQELRRQVGNFAADVTTVQNVAGGNLFRVSESGHVYHDDGRGNFQFLGSWDEGRLSWIQKELDEPGAEINRAWLMRRGLETVSQTQAPPAADRPVAPEPKSESPAPPESTPQPAEPPASPAEPEEPGVPERDGLWGSPEDERYRSEQEKRIVEAIIAARQSGDPARLLKALNQQDSLLDRTFIDNNQTGGDPGLLSKVQKASTATMAPLRDARNEKTPENVRKYEKAVLAYKAALAAYEASLPSAPASLPEPGSREGHEADTAFDLPDWLMDDDNTTGDATGDLNALMPEFPEGPGEEGVPTGLDLGLTDDNTPRSTGEEAREGAETESNVAHWERRLSAAKVADDPEGIYRALMQRNLYLDRVFGEKETVSQLPPEVNDAYRQAREAFFDAKNDKSPNNLQAYEASIRKFNTALDAYVQNQQPATPSPAREETRGESEEDKAREEVARDVIKKAEEGGNPAEIFAAYSVFNLLLDTRFSKHGVDVGGSDSLPPSLREASKTNNDTFQQVYDDMSEQNVREYVASVQAFEKELDAYEASLQPATPPPPEPVPEPSPAPPKPAVSRPERIDTGTELNIGGERVNSKDVIDIFNVREDDSGGLTTGGAVRLMEMINGAEKTGRYHDLVLLANDWGLKEMNLVIENDRGEIEMWDPYDLSGSTTRPTDTIFKLDESGITGNEAPEERRKKIDDAVKDHFVKPNWESLDQHVPIDRQKRKEYFEAKKREADAERAAEMSGFVFPTAEVVTASPSALANLIIAGSVRIYNRDSQADRELKESVQRMVEERNIQLESRLEKYPPAPRNEEERRKIEKEENMKLEAKVWEEILDVEFPDLGSVDGQEERVKLIRAMTARDILDLVSRERNRQLKETNNSGGKLDSGPLARISVIYAIHGGPTEQDYKEFKEALAELERDMGL